MRTEIFVLGTAMYFMEKGAEPRHELEYPWDKEEIQRRVAAREFPDTAELVLGVVIRKCHQEMLVYRVVDEGGDGIRWCREIRTS